jgi:hypothetical protein
MPEKVDLSTDQVRDVVDFVLDSDYTLAQAFESCNIDVFKVSDRSYEDIYAEVFRCDWCGFWYDVSDDWGENTCITCASEGKHDEDDEPSEDDLMDYGDEEQEVD